MVNLVASVDAAFGVGPVNPASDVAEEPSDKKSKADC
ncbi:hypothetical protein J2801_001646 [Paraburkholderia phenoliruptrix]|nr:hypothetical protein [Paraburkholderia phenoliruptrix]